MKAVYDLAHAPQDYCRAWDLGLGPRYHFRSTLTLDVAVFGCTHTGRRSSCKMSKVCCSLRLQVVRHGDCLVCALVLLAADIIVMTVVMNNTSIQTCTGEGMNMFSLSCFKFCLSTRAMHRRGFRSCCLCIRDGWDSSASKPAGSKSQTKHNQFVLQL